jgi:ferredoxin--NADP+ reductase
MYKILSKIAMENGTVVINQIQAPLLAQKARPGQFLILRINESGERIPLTMADTDPEKGSVTIIYQVVGKSTALLASLNQGDFISDVVGPLGKPTDISYLGKVICVGGGTGTGVLHPIARGFKRAGNYVIVVLGARSKNLLIMEKEMQAVSDEFYVCTDDGSAGHHGVVTDILQRRLQQPDNGVKQAVAIGPIPMMRACSQLTAAFNLPTMVSLNALMVDGTGMCGCCRVSVGGEIKFACVAGPEFDGHKVDFDDLNNRLWAYRQPEGVSYRAFQERQRGCQCGGQHV